MQRLPLTIAAMFLPLAAAATPVTIQHAGYLLASDDSPLDALQLSVRFRLYPVDTAGTAAFDATCPVDVQGGYYSVVLGGGCGSNIDSSSLPPVQAAWLEVTIGSTVLQPRQPLVAAPVATVATTALDAVKLNGIAATSLVDGVTGKLLAAALPIGAGLTTSGGNVVVNVGFSSGQVAAGNDSRLVNAIQSSATPGGDLTNTYASPTVAKLQGTPVSATAPSTIGQLLTFDGTTWAPAAAPSTVDPTKLPLAGGTMTGAINMGTKAITNLATPGASADAATKGYADANLGGRTLASTTPALNDVLTWNGSQWVPGASSQTSASVSQASLYGSATWPGTTSCFWSRTSNQTFGSYAAASACPLPSGSNLNGNATAAATKIPAITFPNMPPGEYEILAIGDFTHQTAGAGCAYRFSDGTKSTSPQAFVTTGTAGAYPTLAGHLSYSDTATRTIELQTTSVSGSMQCDVYASVPNLVGLQILVYRFPNATQLAAVAETTPMAWSGSIACSGNPTVAGSGAFNDLSAGTGCALTTAKNVNFGTVALGPNGASVTFTPRKTGTFQIIAKLPMSTSGGNSVAGVLSDGSNNMLGIDSNWPNGGTSALTFFGTLDVTSLATQTVKIRISGGSGTITNQTVNGINSNWSIVDVSQPFGAPVITGSVSTGAGGATRFESAVFSTSGTILSQTGSWISSVTNTGAGFATVNFVGGTWSSTPHCLCGAAEDNNRVCSIGLPSYASTVTTTSAQLRRSVGNTGTNENGYVTLLCMGPR